MHTAKRLSTYMLWRLIGYGIREANPSSILSIFPALLYIWLGRVGKWLVVMVISAPQTQRLRRSEKVTRIHTFSWFLRKIFSPINLEKNQNHEKRKT